VTMTNQQLEEGIALNEVDRRQIKEEVAPNNSGEPPDQNDGRRRSEVVALNTGGRGVMFHHHPQSPLDVNDVDDSKNSTNEYQDAITLPQSTHTFLFTEKLCSLPFGFAFLILVISIACLALALCDNLDGSTDDNNALNVPANVTRSVRLAQFLGVLIAVLMEEEIPTALFLLKMITRASVEDTLNLHYSRFVISALFHLVIGYMFLINVFLVIVQSDRVLDIFYDMMALQFVSMIDDIAFRLAQLDILGKHLRNATSSSCCRTEFERRPYKFRKKMTLLTKFVFVFNLLFLLAGVTTIAVWQQQGLYHCKSITVTFGDDIWEHAWVKGPSGREKNMVLVYSFFNGVYEQVGIHANRPLYREMKKSEDSHFETPIIGAEIKYCEEENAWVFSHSQIKKTKGSDESSCPWLLRSSDTDAYSVMDVDGTWEVWVGVIQDEAKVSVTCNECDVDTDCNLNGVCMKSNKRCHCTNPEFVGSHCHLEKPCPTIISESSNTTWTAVLSGDCESYVYEYGRPYYVLMRDNTWFNKSDQFNIVYVGSRWIMSVLASTDNTDGVRSDLSRIDFQRSNFHAFWDKAFESRTVAISDPTKGRSTPVGADFYRIGEKGDQYGPFGVLYPLQEPAGRGDFRCGKINMTEKIAKCKRRSKDPFPD
ncbi:hypothetical protein ACHAXR_008009, partial [Thalassiosira sp. AJA248-18]